MWEKRNILVIFFSFFCLTQHSLSCSNIWLKTCFMFGFAICSDKKKTLNKKYCIMAVRTCTTRIRGSFFVVVFIDGYLCWTVLIHCHDAVTLSLLHFDPPSQFTRHVYLFVYVEYYFIDPVSSGCVWYYIGGIQILFVCHTVTINELNLI